MILWRVAHYPALDGAGGLHVSGRWHTRGRRIAYYAWNPSMALLEALVHMEIDPEDRPAHFRLLRIEGPDGLALEEFAPGPPLADWSGD